MSYKFIAKTYTPSTGEVLQKKAAELSSRALVVSTDILKDAARNTSVQKTAASVGAVLTGIQLAREAVRRPEVPSVLAVAAIATASLIAVDQALQIGVDPRLNYQNAGNLPLDSLGKA